ncbi:MAG: hypothetical protein FVQ79_00265 [Planctomycetes bacterium]|nr:hypothetical protein [Planctomycetota bacterium]
MSLRVKEHVSIRGLQPQMFHAWNVAGEVYEEVSNADCILTAGVDGKHGHGSLHYVGLAIDLRIRNLLAGWELTPELVEVAEAIQIKLQNRLGFEYDVVLESNHFHIEFQPKEPIE